MLDVFNVFVIFTAISLAHGQVIKSATACFGNTNVECFLTLECEEGSRIQLIREEYGVKEGSCKPGKNRCKKENEGCCAYDSNDCFESYSPLHKYNLYKQCSWQQKCGPIQAPNNVLNTCENKPSSTYVHIEYQCVPENTMMSFCGNATMTKPEINIVFDGATSVYEEEIICDCFVFPQSGAKYGIDVRDARLMKQETSESGSDCSSAVVSELSANIKYPSCDNKKDEQENFFSGSPVLTNKTSALQLSNVYSEGSKDRPMFLWISLTTNDNKDMYVSCIRTPASASTTAIPPTVIPPNGSTQPTNGTNDSQTDDEGSSAAIIAGVLIPILVLAIVAAVVAFIIIKRRRKREKDHPAARPNNYTSDTVSVTQEDEYAEIGIVDDSPEPPVYDPVYESPLYDPVYEPRNKDSAGASTPEENGQTLSGQPPSSLKLPTKVDQRSSNGPLRLISSQTDRFFAWFRNRQSSESSDSKGKNRSREASYDHIHGNAPVIVKVTTPEEEEGHIYSHQKDVPAIDNPIETSPTGGRISKDMSAVYLGNAYIGFTFDKIEEDDPKRLKTQGTENMPNSKPAPPTRPPPSPNNTPRNSTNSSSPLILDSPKTARPKSPMRLSPLAGKEGQENITYDYAESQPNSRRGSDASKSDISEHSYKVLEKPAVYDYADLEDGEQPVDENATTVDSGGSLYEDVEEKLRADSVKKHKSSPDVPEYVSGYEVPLTTKDRPVSAPAKKESKAQNSQTIGNPVIANLNKELLEKNNLKPLKPPTDGKVSPKPGNKRNNVKLNADNEKQNKVISQGKKLTKPISVSSFKSKHSNSGLVKSDNVDTKDYEKADNLKGVRNMAKLFEKKS